MTNRERLVRGIKAQRGLRWREISAAMGFATPTGLLNVLRSATPQDATLKRIRDWLEMHGVVVDVTDIAS